MQFFYVDYMNGDKKERNIGFLKVEQDGMSVGLRGVPMQCGGSCRVYAVNSSGERGLLGEVSLKNGYGMQKLNWTREIGFRDCVAVEIPLYGTRIGKCVLREGGVNENRVIPKPDSAQKTYADHSTNEMIKETEPNIAELSHKMEQKDTCNDTEKSGQEDIVGKLSANKWLQLLEIYPRVHILPEAQSILIKPKDLIVLTEKYHDMAANSFVLHAYYNYRQLLLFCYQNGTEDAEKYSAGTSAEYKDTANIHVADNSYTMIGKPEYYLGVPGIYNERECRVAEMFGFEGFESGEARMHEERERVVYNGCFGYFMKRVEI